MSVLTVTGQGFTEVRSLKVGFESWSGEVARSVPRHAVARDISERKAGLRPLRPLRLIVSVPKGCQSSKAAQ